MKTLNERRRAIYRAHNLLAYLRECSYPYYFLGPGDMEVWVPARYFSIALHACEMLRPFGTRVILKLDEL
jgi:hypothetical protein